MATKKSTNELALVTKTSVSDGLETIKAKIDSLKFISETPYKTNKNIAGVNGTSVNIETCTDISLLVNALASIMSREEWYNKANTELGITNHPVFKLSGSSLEDWKADIKLRIAIIEHKEKYDLLVEAQNELIGMMDKDDRMAILMQKIANI